MIAKFPNSFSLQIWLRCLLYLVYINQKSKKIQKNFQPKKLSFFIQKPKHFWKKRFWSISLERFRVQNKKNVTENVTKTQLRCSQNHKKMNFSKKKKEKKPSFIERILKQVYCVWICYAFFYFWSFPLKIINQRLHKFSLFKCFREH